MGDEEHGFAFGRYGAGQVGLQDHLGLRVQRAEGLVHQQYVGVYRQGTRNAARWRMPPESWCG